MKVQATKRGMTIHHGMDSVELFRVPFSIDDDYGVDQVEELWKYCLIHRIADPEENDLYLLTADKSVVLAWKDEYCQTVCIERDRIYLVSYITNCNRIY